ncbi:hypothetical protein [Citrobacter freundii]|uniref:Uncharacterized protein n=1 Tax=Citrobacter freundii TaxID=546 RepID=A0AAN4JFX1_CITFR|nr:hypothetical protein [Citrobacter freundii]EJT4817566.1 hypothetical protein [Citrobacter freundii]EKV1387317.1 hypothetical protein [Citrobacter freundii]EKW2110444.1 hypothetical protein [Citrobacter freundii]MBM7189182.1 hypothetical protein [Citrobacter freundii]MBM7250094.1 hypothetical protein [Citrobacter freundii]
MATAKEENTKLAEIAAEITKELIKANPKSFDGYSSAVSAFKNIYDAIVSKVGK